jgi:hypothetical protein
MQELELLLDERKEDNHITHNFNHLENRIRCYAHIINVCSGHIVAAVSPPRRKSSNTRSYADDDSDDESDDESPSNDEAAKLPVYSNHADWLAGIKCDPLKRARKVVRFLRSSDQRKENFRAFIINGNNTGLFKNAENGRVEPLQLLRDVKTRWDSVFLMLERLRELRPVSDPIHLKLKITKCSLYCHVTLHVPLHCRPRCPTLLRISLHIVVHIALRCYASPSTLSSTSPYAATHLPPHCHPRRPTLLRISLHIAYVSPFAFPMHPPHIMWYLGHRFAFRCQL